MWMLTPGSDSAQSCRTEPPLTFSPHSVLSSLPPSSPLPSLSLASSLCRSFSRSALLPLLSSITSFHSLLLSSISSFHSLWRRRRRRRRRSVTTTTRATATRTAAARAAGPAASLPPEASPPLRRRRRSRRVGADAPPADLRQSAGCGGRSVRRDEG